MKVVYVALGVLVLVVVVGIALVFRGGPSFASDASPVMYFYSDSCKYCQMQKPILEELSKEGFRVKLMDVAKNPYLWRQYSVEGTPTFIAKNGDRLVGFQQKETLRLWLDNNGAKIA